jgi:H+/Cl- antiporter ClcA
MDQQTGKWIIIAGVALVIAGLVIWLFHDKLHWIGRLPGDIRVEREHFRFYFPITTMILFSLVLTLLIYLFKRFF